MRKLARTGAAALMLTCMAGNVLAATTEAAGCARPEDMTAIKAAAVQQKLMVAALSCNANSALQQIRHGLSEGTADLRPGAAEFLSPFERQDRDGRIITPSRRVLPTPRRCRALAT